MALGTAPDHTSTVATTAVPRAHLTVVRGARLFDGDRPVPLAAPTVVIDGSRIAAVGVPVPEHAEVVDLPGATLLPGLVDTHVHLAFDASTDPVGTLTAWDDAAALAAMADAARTASRPGRDHDGARSRGPLLPGSRPAGSRGAGPADDRRLRTAAHHARRPLPLPGRRVDRRPGDRPRPRRAGRRRHQDHGQRRQSHAWQPARAGAVRAGRAAGRGRRGAPARAAGHGPRARAAGRRRRGRGGCRRAGARHVHDRRRRGPGASRPARGDRRAAGRPRADRRRGPGCAVLPPMAVRMPALLANARLLCASGAPITAGTEGG